jgi:hypothetical protein
MLRSLYLVDFKVGQTFGERQAIRKLGADGVAMEVAGGLLIRLPQGM